MGKISFVSDLTVFSYRSRYRFTVTISFHVNDMLAIHSIVRYLFVGYS